MLIENKILKYDKYPWRDLIPYQPDEIKKISQTRLEKLKTSLRNNGFLSPFYVFQKEWKGNGVFVLDAHQRIRAMKSLLADGEDVPNEVPVIYLDVNSEEEAKFAWMAYQSHYGEMVKTEFMDFTEDLNFDEIKLQFEPFKLGFNMNRKEDRGDEIPEGLEQIPAITKDGDIYELGEHRVICGDSTDPEIIEKLMNYKQADLLLTDPPYGINYVELKSKSHTSIENDDGSEESFDIISNCLLNACEHMHEKACIYAFCAQGPDMLNMIASLHKSGLSYRQMLIWNKNGPNLGRSDYNYKHEPILYGWKKTHKFYGLGDQKTSVWDYPKPQKSELHPTMKPVALLKNAIENSTEINMLVLDIFLGSGSTLIACEDTKRVCYGVEKDPHYVDIIIQRYVNHTENNQIKKNGEPIEWSLI